MINSFFVSKLSAETSVMSHHRILVNFETERWRILFVMKFVGRNFCGIHHDITEKFWAETMLKNHFDSSFVGKIKFFWHFERVAQLENTSLDFSKSLRFMFKNIIIENKCYMNDCKQKLTLIILIDWANFVRPIFENDCTNYFWRSILWYLFISDIAYIYHHFNPTHCHAMTVPEYSSGESLYDHAFPFAIEAK